MTTRTQPVAQPRLHYRRALTTFILAYISVTILGIALSIFIGIIGHYPSAAEALQNQAYLVSERFYPFMNLVVWSLFAWAYFRKRAKQAGKISLTREARTLGAFWVVAAIIVDYVGFVVIKNPISLSPHDFYIGQFPWIYLIYVAIALSPLCYIALLRRAEIQ
ncbi:hypothetical protein GCM10011507_12910 [Edaphobacter acidisoli]|uniref:Uncharacterized protein n=1 Tax=Edaphobacter acidisoli TaxID=2040573 RepID=A0A916W3A0_9BACT|nr:hypothetical protein [Edaphobacter acidisoli]GGA62740.1 hypothetical protein GCM10011507_12910 [Edaphobacter acidisoli]